MKAAAYIRAAEESDLNFIYSSWLKAMRRTTGHIDKEVFYPNHRRLVEALIDKSQILIACSDEDQNQIFGYLVKEERFKVPILHFLYVKSPFRRMGIGTQLFKMIGLPEGALMPVTHFTAYHEYVAPKWGLVYNPYLLRSV